MFISVKSNIWYLFFTENIQYFHNTHNFLRIKVYEILWCMFRLKTVQYYDKQKFDSWNVMVSDHIVIFTHDIILYGLENGFLWVRYHGRFLMIWRIFTFGLVLVLKSTFIIFRTCIKYYCDAREDNYIIS